jgi:hypothetical protein
MVQTVVVILSVQILKSEFLKKFERIRIRYCPVLPMREKSYFFMHHVICPSYARVVQEREIA